MTSIDALLADRSRTHGDFSDQAWITQAMKEIMRREPGWARLSPVQREALEMLAHKIGRVLAGNPLLEDHWRDMAGYSTLVADRLPPDAVR